MESLSFKFNMEDQRPIFPLGDTKPTITDGYTASDGGSIHPSEAVFTPMSSQFQGRTSNELLNLLAQEPRAADTAPSTCEIDMSNFRISSSDVLFEDTDSSNLFMEGGRTESVASSANQWGNTSRASPNVSRNNEMMDTFEFLVKSLSSANNYVSMLTREQLQVMRAIRPGLLYEFLQEVAKVRSDKRMRRAFSHECAFCKNNGESEECYMTHALKDWRGRVTCPVLRAFHCPRCGATGDRAHTIKYCPENDGTSDRSSFTFRRRVPSSASLLLGPQQSGVGSGMRSSQPPTPTPAQSPSAATAGYSQSSLWSTFRMN